MLKGEILGTGGLTGEIQKQIMIAGWKIHSVSINGIILEPDENKNININVPTKVSELENDAKYIRQDEVDFSNFYTKSETYSKEEVDALQQGNSEAISNINRILGEKANESDLPQIINLEDF